MAGTSTSARGACALAVTGMLGCPVLAAAGCPDLPSIRHEAAPAPEHDPGCDLWPFQLARPAGSDGGSYLRFGGEVRQRYEHTDNPNFGQDPDDPHGAWLQRYGFFGDLQLNGTWRLFAELHSALENGRAAGPGPTDEDELDLQSAFVEARLWSTGSTEVTVRAGRQELDWGSSRLVSVRDGPNVRRTFDGLRLTAQRGDWTVSAVALRPRADEQGVFDDSTDEDRALWGLYSTRTWDGDRGIDLYYLGYGNDEPTYEQGSARERRHSLGLRYFGSNGPWDWDIEPVVQFGSYGDGDIRAWTVASETGYTWRGVRWSPRLILSANVASGDRDPLDPDLQTFSPLYPRGNYFSEDATLWPQNFFNIHLFLTINPAESWVLTVDYDAFWRMSDDDAVYGPNGSVLRADGGSDERFVASAASINSEWFPDRHWTFTAIYTHVSPRGFIEQTGPAEAIDFVELTARFRF